MMVLIDLFEFEVIVPLKLGVASSHAIDGFQHVITKKVAAKP